jgi:hypothetical protein
MLAASAREPVTDFESALGSRVTPLAGWGQSSWPTRLPEPLPALGVSYRLRCSTAAAAVGSR